MRSLLLLCFLAAVAFAAPLKLADVEAKDVPIRAKVLADHEQTSTIKGLTKAKLARLFKGGVQAGETECKICIDFMDEALQNLIEIIANGGIIGGCADLCSMALANKSEILEGVCNILCDIAGIDVLSGSSLTLTRTPFGSARRFASATTTTTTSPTSPA